MTHEGAVKSIDVLDKLITLAHQRVELLKEMKASLANEFGQEVAMARGVRCATCGGAIGGHRRFEGCKEFEKEFFHTYNCLKKVG